MKSNGHQRVHMKTIAVDCPGDLFCIFPSKRRLEPGFLSLHAAKTYEMSRWTVTDTIGCTWSVLQVAILGIFFGNFYTYFAIHLSFIHNWLSTSSHDWEELPNDRIRFDSRAGWRNLSRCLTFLILIRIDSTGYAVLANAFGGFFEWTSLWR